MHRPELLLLHPPVPPSIPPQPRRPLSRAPVRLRSLHPSKAPTSPVAARGPVGGRTLGGAARGGDPGPGGILRRGAGPDRPCAGREVHARHGRSSAVSVPVPGPGAGSRSEIQQLEHRG